MLVVTLVKFMSVPVEAHYCTLSSDIALVFCLYGGRVQFTIVLVVADKLFMPVNCLYSSAVVV